MLAAMFSRKFETKPSEDGAFFIEMELTSGLYLIIFAMVS